MAVPIVPVSNNPAQQQTSSDSSKPVIDVKAQQSLAVKENASPTGVVASSPPYVQLPDGTVVANPVTNPVVVTAPAPAPITPPSSYIPSGSGGGVAMGGREPNISIDQLNKATQTAGGNVAVLKQEIAKAQETNKAAIVFGKTGQTPEGQVKTVTEPSSGVQYKVDSKGNVIGNDGRIAYTPVNVPTAIGVNPITSPYNPKNIPVAPLSNPSTSPSDVGKTLGMKGDNVLLNSYDGRAVEISPVQMTQLDSLSGQFRVQYLIDLGVYPRGTFFQVADTQIKGSESGIVLPQTFVGTDGNPITLSGQDIMALNNINVPEAKFNKMQSLGLYDKNTIYVGVDESSGAIRTLNVSSLPEKYQEIAKKSGYQELQRALDADKRAWEDNLKNTNPQLYQLYLDDKTPDKSEYNATIQNLQKSYQEFQNKLQSGEILKSNTNEYITKDAYNKLSVDGQKAWMNGGFTPLVDAEKYVEKYKTPDGGYNLTQLAYDANKNNDDKLTASAVILFGAETVKTAQETFHPTGEWIYRDPITGTTRSVDDSERTNILNEKGWNSNYYDLFSRSDKGAESLIAQTRFDIKDWAGQEVKPPSVDELSQIASSQVVDIETSVNKTRLAENIAHTIYNRNDLGSAFGSSSPIIMAKNVDEVWNKLTDEQKQQVANNYQNRGQLMVSDVTEYANQLSKGLESLYGKVGEIPSDLVKIPASIGVGVLNTANAIGISLPLAVVSAITQSVSGQPKGALAGLSEIPLGMAEYAFVTAGKRISENPISGIGVLVGELFAPKIAGGVIGTIKEAPIFRRISTSEVSNDPDVGRAAIRGGMDAQFARALVEDIQKVWNGNVPEVISKYGNDIEGALAQYYISKALGKDVSLTTAGQREGGIYGVGTAWNMVNKNSGFHATGDLTPFVKSLQEKGNFVIDADFLEKGVSFNSPQLAEQFMRAGLKEGTQPGGMAKFFSEKDLRALPDKYVDALKYLSTKEVIQMMKEDATKGLLKEGIYPVYKFYYNDKGIPTFELEFIDTPGMKWNAMKGGYPYNSKYGTASLDMPSRITVVDRFIKTVDNFDMIDNTGNIVLMNLNGKRLEYGDNGGLKVDNGLVRVLDENDKHIGSIKEVDALAIDKNGSENITLLKAGDHVPLLFISSDAALAEGIKPPSMSKLLAAWALDSTLGSGQRMIGSIFAPRPEVSGTYDVGISTSVGYNLPKMQFSEVNPMSRLSWAMKQRESIQNSNMLQQPFTDMEFESAGGKLGKDGTVVEFRRYWHEDSPQFTGWVRDRVTGIIRDESGGILLLDEKANQRVGIPEGVYSLPGGGVEKGITLENLLRKEANEELGVEVENLRRLPTYLGKSNEHSAPGTWLIEADTKSKNLRLKTDEINNAKWIKSGDNLIVTPATYDILRSIDGFDVSNLTVYDAKWSKSYRNARDANYAERIGSNNTTKSRQRPITDSDGKLGTQKSGGKITKFDDGDNIPFKRSGDRLLVPLTDRGIKEKSTRDLTPSEQVLVSDLGVGRESLSKTEGELKTSLDEALTIGSDDTLGGESDKIAMDKGEKSYALSAEKVGIPSSEKGIYSSTDKFVTPSTEKLPTSPYKPASLIADNLPMPIGKPYLKGREDILTRDQKMRAFEGALGWKQGFGYWFVKAPYKTNADVAFFRTPPPNAQVVEGGANAAYRSIQQLTGKPPSRALKIPLGIVTVRIKKPSYKAGESGAISFKMNKSAKKGRDTGIVRILNS